MRAAPDPRILTGWSGASPRVLRFPLRAFLRFPVCPPGSPPSPAFPWFPFVRRSPVRSLRPLPGFRFPFGLPPVSLPSGNLHDSAAGGRFRRRWSRAARAKVTSPAAAAPCPDLAVIRPALQMGNGWARGDAATESPVASGCEPWTPLRPNRPDQAVLGCECNSGHPRSVIRLPQRIPSRAVSYRCGGLSPGSGLTVVRRAGRTTSGLQRPSRWSSHPMRCRRGRGICRDGSR